MKINKLLLILIFCFALGACNGCYKQSNNKLNEPRWEEGIIRPRYSFFTEIGSVTTKTRDTNSNYIVKVEMLIGSSIDDDITKKELNTKKDLLKDFVITYFSEKYKSEIEPEYEEEIKREMLKIINSRYLASGKARIIVFNQLDVEEE